MSASAHIHQCADQLYLISLPVPIKGFDGFIGAWVYAGDPLVLVDVGPTVSADCLLNALAELGLGAPEFILLTHIHIDHAGGIGRVSTALPKATVVSHPIGIPHLIDPGRLWKGSLKTLGAIARAYGPIDPLAGEKIVAMDQLKHPQIQCIETPGHASHHVSYTIGDLLFAGEAGGVCLEMPDDITYLRPATPPRFFLETHVESIDRLIAKSPRQICYSHIGHRDEAVRLLHAHRRQLLHWLEMVRPFHAKANDDDAVQHLCADHLLAQDPLLKGFTSLPMDVQQRERNFIINSIKGYWEYLGSQGDPDENLQQRS